MDWTMEKTKLFVKNVQDHPFLYNGTLSSRQLVQDTWCKIAKTIGSTGPECIRRWQLLRNGYSQRDRNQEPSGVEPYLTFLDPFVKTPPEELRDPIDSFVYCLKLIRAVQEYPELYDKNKKSPSGSKAWEQVANRMGTGDSPAQCQSRWDKLLARYMRHLRTNWNMKPVGIEYHLEFITPLKQSLKFTFKLVNLVREVPELYESTYRKHPAWESVAEQMENGVTAHDCEFVWNSLRSAYRNFLYKGRPMRPLGIENHMCFLKAYEKAEEDNPVAAKKSRLDEKSSRRRRRDSAVAAVRKLNNLRFDEDDEDLLFLLMFLPDMAQMDEKQKLNFKLNAMRAVEEVRES